MQRRILSALPNLRSIHLTSASNQEMVVELSSYLTLAHLEIGSIGVSSLPTVLRIASAFPGLRKLTIGCSMSWRDFKTFGIKLPLAEDAPPWPDELNDLETLEVSSCINPILPWMSSLGPRFRPPLRHMKDTLSTRHDAGPLNTFLNLHGPQLNSLSLGLEDGMDDYFRIG